MTFWVPEGSLAGSSVRHHLALELVSGADFLARPLGDFQGTFRDCIACAAPISQVCRLLACSGVALHARGRGCNPYGSPKGSGCGRVANHLCVPQKAP